MLGKTNQNNTFTARISLDIWIGLLLGFLLGILYATQSPKTVVAIEKETPYSNSSGNNTASNPTATDSYTNIRKVPNAG